VQPAARIPPPPWLTAGPVARVLAALPGARAVGGAVRDTLAGRPVHDVDLATPLPPDQAAARLAAAGLRVVPTGVAHGTITAIADRTAIEVTTLRRDVATDGRHAVVAFDADWREDAARRDFTINAMSLDAEGGLYDWFDGRADLAAGRVRFVGDPATRIAEDRLRALRYFRFLARHGAGQPDTAAVAAIAASAGELGALSAERVAAELLRILEAPDPGAALRLMETTGVRATILPEGAEHAALARLLAAEAPPDPWLRLAALLPAGTDIAALRDRLRLSHADAERLALLRAGPAPLPAMDDAALARLLAEVPAAILVGRAWLAQPAGADVAWDGLRARLAVLPVPVFPLRAADLDLPPGPRLGRALAAMRAVWLDQGCVADRAALAAEAARRIAAGLL
jgi:poly(A) polymerase/tRNA nucleotidyltransferase (CCA-adding enzyme)